MNKAISTPIAIIIVLIVFTISIGLILLGYTYWPKGEVILEENQEQIEDEFTDWITYVNENGGYIIKYPSDLSLEHRVAEAGKTVPDFIDNVDIESIDDSNSLVDWRIEVYKNTEGLTVEEFAEQVGGVTTTKNKIITDINIDGINGKKVVIDYLPTDADPEYSVLNATSIFIVKGTNIYTFLCFNKITQKSGIKVYDSIRFEQMLSTFKFIEKEEEADTSLLIYPST